MSPVCVRTPPTAEARFPGLTVRAQLVVGSCLCAGATAFLFAVDPSRHAVYPQCLLYRATGFYCAGCGTTRALYALLHGRVLEALHDNLLFVSALPFLLGVAALYAGQSWRANAWAAAEIEARPLFRRGAGIFLAMVLFMILRNLPGPSFAWLRPLAP
jgi:hypothetical protein